LELAFYTGKWRVSSAASPVVRTKRLLPKHMQQEPSVFIIILNWNGLHDTLECLESIAKLNYQNRRVIVVDNGSVDASTTEIKAAHPDIILFENKTNLGYTGGNNLGLRYALENGADYAWLLNNDTIVDRECLSRLIAAAEQHRDIGLISPIIYQYYESDRIQFCGTLVDWRTDKLVAVKTPLVFQDEILAANLMLWGTALLVKSSMVRQIGYLDERYFAYHEDIDYSMRAIEAGFRTFLEPTAVVYHKTSRSLGAHSPIVRYFMWRNIYLLWMTRLQGWKKYSYPARYLALVLASAVRYKVEGMDSTASGCLEGAWSAIRGHFGPRRDGSETRVALKKILRIFSWHPHFWIALFEGHFRRILFEGARRMSLRVRQYSGL